MKKPDIVYLGNKLLKKSFPSLRRTTIYLGWNELEPDAFMICAPYNAKTPNTPGTEYYTDVDIIMIDAPLAAIIGGLTHEFSHIEEWVNNRRLWTPTRFRRVETSPKLRGEDEIKTDLRVIAKGLGMGLLEFSRYAENVVAAGLKEAIDEGGIPTEHLEYIIKADGRLPHPFTYRDYINYFGNGDG